MTVTRIPNDNRPTPSTLWVSQLTPEGTALASVKSGAEDGQVYVPAHIVSENKLGIGGCFWGMVAPTQADSLHNLPYQLSKYLGDIDYNEVNSNVSVHKLYNTKWDAELDAQNGPDIVEDIDIVCRELTRKEINAMVLDAIESCTLSTVTTDDILHIVFGDGNFPREFVERVQKSLDDMCLSGEVILTGSYRLPRFGEIAIK